MAANGIKQTVLVTGASGLIGRAVLQELLAKQTYDLRAQVRSRSNARAEIGSAVDLTRLSLAESDFTQIADREFKSLTQDCKTVIHLAGLVHRPEAPYQEYEVVNVRATQMLAEAAAQNGAETFVFMSSSAIYGAGPFDSAQESEPAKGKTPYAVSKMTSETWLQTFRGIPRIIILRPSLVFGEGDRGNLLSLIREIKSNRYRQVGNGATGKSIIYSKDLAHGIGLCLERLGPGVHVFNIANPQPVSMKELTETIGKALNTGVKIQSVPAPLARLGLKAAQVLMPGKVPITEEQLEKLMTTTTCSVNKLVSATGFGPRTDLESAIKAEIAWATASHLI